MNLSLIKIKDKLNNEIYNKLINKNNLFEIIKSVLFIKNRSFTMKYHEKINLKSPIYKYSNNNTSRTPTKSPLKPSVNPVQLFQKVCCPNCKYAFKIIKQQILKQNPLEIATPVSKKSRVKQKKSTEVQTQNQPIITVHNSPVKSSKSPMRLSRSPGLNVNKNIENYKMNKLSEILHSQNTENRRLREPQFKFKPLSVSSNEKFMKSKNLLKTLDPRVLSSDTLRVQQAYKFQNDNELMSPTQGKFNLSLNDSMYGQQRTDDNYLQSPRKSTQKFSSNQKKNTYRQHVPREQDEQVINRNRSHTGVENVNGKYIDFSKKEHNQIILRSQEPLAQKVCCRCKDNSSFNSFIIKTVLKSEQNQNVIHQLQQLCREVSEQVQVPSYCKMLAISQ